MGVAGDEIKRASWQGENNAKSNEAIRYEAELGLKAMSIQC